MKMNQIEFVFRLDVDVVISIGQFCCIGFEAFLWMISVRRQTSRMNIQLFRSLLQRVSINFVVK